MTIILPFGAARPEVAESAWVAPNAALIGDVTLHEKSSVFYGSVLRAEHAAIVLGAGSNLQDNVTVHVDENTPALIGAGVSVGHGAILHGCVIEDNCLIGMGSIVLNRAVIGYESLVAAGAVVLEDTVIPPHSLVAGVPAKVRRQLNAEEIEHLHHNASSYVTLAVQHNELS